MHIIKHFFISKPPGGCSAGASAGGAGTSGAGAGGTGGRGAGGAGDGAGSGYTISSNCLMSYT